MSFGYAVVLPYFPRVAFDISDVGPSKPSDRRGSVANLQSTKAWLSHKESLNVVLHECVVCLVSS